LKELFGDDRVGVDIGAIERRDQAGMRAEGLHRFCSEGTNVDEAACKSRSGRHWRTDQMGTTAGTLPPFEVAIRCRRAAFAGAEAVCVHAQAHRATRFTPLETGGLEDAIEHVAFGLRLC